VRANEAYYDKHFEACNNGYRYLLLLPSNPTDNSYKHLEQLVNKMIRLLELIELKS